MVTNGGDEPVWVSEGERDSGERVRTGESERGPRGPRGISPRSQGEAASRMRRGKLVVTGITSVPAWQDEAAGWHGPAQCWACRWAAAR